MKVSIITLTYNSEENILKCLDSIKYQKYDNIEHIIIDGKSSDSTLKIVDKNIIDNSIIISEKDSGIYDAWNKGLEVATGDIVGTVMSDDFLENKNVVNKIVEAFKENDCDIVYANMNFELKNQIVRKWKPGKFTKKSFYFGWMPPPPTVYVSRKIIRDNLGFNKKYRIAGDYEWLLRLFFIKNYKIFYLDEFIYTLKMGGVSNSSLKNILKGNIECFHAWRENNLARFPFWVFLKPISRIFQILNIKEFFKFYFLK
tara:strand:- start:22259 stop:23029 length:771 start_codon:yes stop_codon:yes gene_type:complete